MKMFLVMLSSGSHSDREEHPLGFTSDRALAEQTVLALEKLIAPLYELVYRTGYDSRESKKYAQDQATAYSEINRIFGDGVSCRIDNFSGAWMREIGEIPAPSAEQQPGESDASR